MDDKLVTIAEYETEEEADLAKQTLADAGIESIIAGSGRMNPFAGIPAVGDVKLQVMQKDAEQARQILEEQEQQDRQED